MPTSADEYQPNDCCGLVKRRSRLRIGRCSVGEPYCCASSIRHRSVRRPLSLTTRRSQYRLTRSVVPTRPDAPAIRDIVASRDSRPEERASRAQSRRVRALLRGVRSHAPALHSGTPQEIARRNRPLPSDRKNFSLVPGSRQRPVRRREFQDLATRRCSCPKNNLVGYSSQNRSCHSASIVNRSWRTVLPRRSFNFPKKTQTKKEQ